MVSRSLHGDLLPYVKDMLTTENNSTARSLWKADVKIWLPLSKSAVGRNAFGIEAPNFSTFLKLKFKLLLSQKAFSKERFILFQAVKENFRNAPCLSGYKS